jgi:excisionase family DNA binding protein
VAGAAAYLSVSVWTVRDLIAAGQLARVRLEVAGRELRRVLVDRADLDALITEGKR